MNNKLVTTPLYSYILLCPLSIHALSIRIQLANSSLKCHIVNNNTYLNTATLKYINPKHIYIAYNNVNEWVYKSNIIHLPQFRLLEMTPSYVKMKICFLQRESFKTAHLKPTF